MARKAVEIGDVKISYDVIAELAGLAALECYGIVGMTYPSLTAGAAQILSRDKLRKGVQIREEEGKLRIELYVIIEYGVNLVEVAKNLIDRVKYEIKKYTGIDVDSVDVFVQGIKKGK